MKSLMIAVFSVASVAVAAPAMAQTLANPQAYVNLGYTYLNPNDRDLGEITGRAGLRLSPYYGVEGELGGGVFGNRFTTRGGQHATLTEGITPSAYGVVYYPLMQGRIDLLARAGYSETPLTLKTDTGSFTNISHSINYGVGAQYMQDAKNGVRVDWTRRDFQEPNAPKDDDTYAVSLVHKF
jgi:outer membrane immunogenic protein